MAFCGKCGKELSGAGKFCPQCGAPVQVPPQQPQYQQNYQQGYQAQQNYQQQSYQQAAPQPEPVAAGNVAEGAMAVLSYFSILVLVPIFAGKHSRYASYHANQGFTLFLLEVAWNLLIAIISGIITAIATATGAWGALAVVGVFTAIGSIGSALCLVLAIFGVINCCKGRMKELPVIGKIKILKNRV